MRRYAFTAAFFYHFLTAQDVCPIAWHSAWINPPGEIRKQARRRW